jgi:hypothetical protein
MPTTAISLIELAMSGFERRFVGKYLTFVKSGQISKSGSGFIYCFLLHG